MDWYKDTLTPRVSNIVEFVFPFEGEDKRRYADWCIKNWFTDEEYLKQAQDIGTLVHESLEEWIDNKKDVDVWRWGDWKEWGKKWLEEQKEEFNTEQYVRCGSLYQWTCDLYNEEELILADWKTWEVAKKVFNIKIKPLHKNGKPPKPTSRLKKVQLQMSLYAYAINKDKYEEFTLKALWLREEGCFEYVLKPIPREELIQIIKDFYKLRHLD